MVNEKTVDFKNFSLDWDVDDMLADKIAEAICLDKLLIENNTDELCKTCTELFGDTIINKALANINNGIVNNVQEQTINAIKNANSLRDKAEILLTSDPEIIHVVYSIYDIMTNDYKDQYVGLYMFKNPVQFMEFNARLHRDRFMIVDTLTRA